MIPEGGEDTVGSLAHLRRVPGGMTLDEAVDGLTLRSSANGTKSLIGDFDPMIAQHGAECFRNLARIENSRAGHIEKD
jgi:hypothetical protein